MTPEEKLAALQQEAEGLRAKADTEAFNDQDAIRATEVAKEAQELKAQIDRRKEATKALSGMKSAVHDSTDDAPAGASRKAKSLGGAFVQSDAYKAFKERHPTAVPKDTPVSVKADGLGRLAKKDVLTTTGAGQAAPVDTGEVEDLVFQPERRLLQVISRGSTDLAWFKYRQVISKTNNAAIVPEHGTTVDVADSLKPLSTLTTTTAEAKEFTYADGMEVTNQELSDDGIMESLIDSTLRENLEILIEDILLNGDADAGEQPNGLFNTTGILQQAFVDDPQKSLRKAITKLRTTSGATIRGVLLNPEDDEAWDLIQDTTNRYLGNGPFGTGPSTAWGYERIESQAIPVGRAVIGDFSTIHLLDYEPISVLAFNQHKDYAQRNLVYIRAELRAVQLIRNAAKLCVVDLAAAEG